MGRPIDSALVDDGDSLHGWELVAAPGHAVNFIIEQVMTHPPESVTLAVTGKYTSLRDAYASIIKAYVDAGLKYCRLSDPELRELAVEEAIEIGGRRAGDFREDRNAGPADRTRRRARRCWACLDSSRLWRRSCC